MLMSITTLPMSPSLVRPCSPNLSRSDRVGCRLRVVVLVVPTDPQLEPVALVTALRCAVEDRVVAHQELVPTSLSRIGLVDGVIVQDEGAEARALGQVPDDVGAGVGRVSACDGRQLLEHRL